MAGDWIKMRTNLDTDPAVVRISSGLNTDRFGVVGRLHKIWAWANEHLTDGLDVPIDSAFLDSLVETQGFAEQLRRVGWLSGRDGNLAFPGFLKHNGTSAKQRALDSQRKKMAREPSGKCPDANRTKSGPEKRREEKRREDINTNNCAEAEIFLQDPEEKPARVMLTFPDVLDVPTFHAAWRDEWLPYQRNLDAHGREPPLQTQLAQLTGLARYGPTKGIAAIRASIHNGWKGLFPEKLDGRLEKAKQINRKPSEILRERQAKSHEPR